MKKLVPYLLLLLLLVLAACAAPNDATPTPTNPGAATASPSVAPTGTVPAQPTPSPITLPTVVAELPAASPTPGPSPTPGTAFLDNYLPRRVKVAETEHFIFYMQDDYEPVDMEWWQSQAEIVYDHVSRRMNDSHIKRKISLAFIPPETRACPVRGLASNDNGLTVLVYADQESSRAYLLGVLAHEIGHAISYDFPNGLPGHITLSEGLATWASEVYWSEWKNVPSLDALNALYLAEGEYEPLHEIYEFTGIYPWQDNTSDGAACIARRDRLYSQWGGFTGYLINTYGWEKILQLYQLPTEERDGKRIIYPPDYEGIYGKSLNQLEQEWLTSLILQGGQKDLSG